jgi:nicotinate phosphoribosyltransferase
MRLLRPELCVVLNLTDLAAQASAYLEREFMIIESLLDTDLYKFTMQQVVFHRFPQATAEYEFRLRSQGIDLRPYAEEIRAEVAHLCDLRLNDEEIEYLRTVRYLHPSYVEALERFELDPQAVQITTDGEFEITVKGNWFQTILFEVPLLSIVNEVYFRNTQSMTEELQAEGRRRLEEKIGWIQDSELTRFNLIEFGTRRRYSRDWQGEVVQELKARLPDALMGTSNVHFARTNGLRPFGTMAHEILQACQAFAPLPEFQKFAFETWMQEYRGDLGIALSDVVGMDAFLNDFDRLFSKAYDGARHDSGDPYEWGEKLIRHYTKYGIDPRTKAAVFSDGLTIPKAIDLARHFQGRILTSFGVGTNLTNDLGVEPLQIVIKMTQCNGQPVAKLSDSPGKTICKDQVYLDYLRGVFVGKGA